MAKCDNNCGCVVKKCGCSILDNKWFSLCWDHGKLFTARYHSEDEQYEKNLELFKKIHELII